jgi:WS/DGAT/MGAT family acyltransferase
MDASFLYMETPDMHAHVIGTILVDPSTVPGGYSFQAIKQMLADRIHLLAPFRRRVMEVPLSLAHPVWIEDPNFDLDHHLHRIGAPGKGTLEDLAEVVGDLASTPLDRRRPLWEMWVVEGLENGHVALVTKVHHSNIDGVTGADLMVNLFDLSPEVAPAPRPDDWQPEKAPSELELVGYAFGRMARQPARLARTMVKLCQGVFRVVENRRRPDAPPAAFPLTAPKTPFNAAITSRRAVAYGRASLEDMKVIKRAFGTTVNDVVLAACTMSLRRWLLAEDALPDKPLVASVPVSVHTEANKDEPGTNKVSVMFVALPVQAEDPVEQLRLIQEETKGAKEVHKALGAELLTGLAEFAPPRLLNQASHLYSRLNLADRHRPIHNLIISNVPGPSIPLYCAGAQVVATYPMGPIMEGCGLNITVLSYLDNVDFGAIACRDLVPRIFDLAAGFADAVAELRQAADAAGVVDSAATVAGAPVAAVPAPEPPQATTPEPTPATAG